MDAGPAAKLQKNKQTCVVCHQEDHEARSSYGLLAGAEIIKRKQVPIPIKINPNLIGASLLVVKSTKKACPFQIRVSFDRDAD